VATQRQGQGVLRKFIGGEVIFRQGEAGHVMYFIASGKVRIFQTVRGKEKTLAILTKGSFFGELALFTKRQRSATAMVTADAELIEVDSEKLDEFLDSNPVVTKRMVMALAARLRETDDLLENMRLEDADSRVTNALLQAVEEQGEGFSHCDIVMDVHQLVVKTTLQSDEVKRILTILKRINIIQVIEGRIHIPSVEMLRGYHAFLGARGGYIEQIT
jgi:CRP-like cAMP-binding protein